MIKTVHEITELLKGQNLVLAFFLWYSYDRLTMNMPYILLLRRTIERYLDHCMMIWKLRLCSSFIEAFVDRWGWSIVYDLENGGQASAEHVGQNFEVR